MAAHIGDGSSISFSSGFFAEITNIKWSGIERETIDSGHLGSSGSAKNFIVSTIYDPGELEVEMHFQGDTAPPFAGALETVTVTMPSSGVGSTSTWAASGALTGFEFELPYQDKQVGKAKIKFSGAITITA